MLCKLLTEKSAPANCPFFDENRAASNQIRPQSYNMEYRNIIIVIGAILQSLQYDFYGMLKWKKATNMLSTVT